MQDCGNLHILQHYSQFLCRHQTPFIEWFPNDVGNECFMLGPGPNILILLSKADTGLAGGEPCRCYLQSLLIIYGSQAHEQFLNGLRYITTLIYIIAPSTPTLRAEITGGETSGFYNHNTTNTKPQMAQENKESNRRDKTRVFKSKVIDDILSNSKSMRFGWRRGCKSIKFGKSETHEDSYEVTRV